MPELPEVETVRKGLAEILISRDTILEVRVLAPKLRRPLDKKLLHELKGQKLLGLRRRAKFLLWDLSSATLINHLGMTGCWRHQKNPGFEKHDHFALKFKKTGWLIYNDPRRFGLLHVVPSAMEIEDPWLCHLGVEPLGDEFSGSYLREKSSGRKIAVKKFIMDQKVVVGVGNIYASEALFLAGIRPRKAVHMLSEKDFHCLAQAIRKVLRSAIRAGGTTIKDFKQAGGESGYFQTRLDVYGRAGQACKCGTLIKQAVLGQRSTFWCPSCQG